MKLAITAAILCALPALALADTDAHYYKRTRGVGVFHSSRFILGAVFGQAPDLMDGAPAPGAMPGATKDVTMLSLGFEATYLGLPSSFGHFHGLEMASGIRTGPWDFWLQGGTAVTLFNLGHGGPFSLRLGGGFGAGFDFAHAYGYVRGRAALVLVPEKVDAEASVTWSPPSAGTGNYDLRSTRVSVWVRTGRRARAVEGYVEAFHRLDDAADKAREIDGMGGGVGMSFF
ncbi:MAG TPA: hypothetical protein VHE35_34245 [Kofleriaceae bacterium]|nr:hypothetical protein [Kofleriaceae bacterium]